MFFVIILVIFLTLCGSILYVYNRRSRKYLANINGPTQFATLWEMIFKLTPKTFFQYGEEKVKKYGRTVRVCFLHRTVVVSSDVNMNEQLLTSHQHIVKHRNYDILNQWLGSGLLVSHGKKWHSRRKVITPAFHFKILEEFVEVFHQQSNIFVENLAEKATGRTVFNVYPYVCLAALDVIAETAMGTKIHAQKDSNAEYASAVNEMTKLMAWRFLKVHLHNEIAFAILCPHLKWKQSKLISSMHKFTSNVIKERRDLLQASILQNNEPTKQNSSQDEASSGKKRMALLDLLLQSNIDGQPLSDADIQEEVDTFMFEGHDTSTSAISFALHLIARHPVVQNKLLNEVKTIFDSPGSPVTIQHLNNLKYTEKVIKETLRLFPSVPIIGRQIRQDFTYKDTEVGSGIIPGGTEYLINIYGMGRDDKYFENANDFLPDRAELDSNAYNFILLPFSAGPRNCVGQKFAMLEMKMVIAKTVLAYELLPMGAPVEPELNITLRSSTGFQLGMKKREIL